MRGLFLLMAVVNAAISGFVIYLGISLGWGIYSVIVAVTFSLSAMVLLNTPYSQKNIDLGRYDILRLLLILALIIIRLNIDLKDDLEEVWLDRGLTLVVLVTIILLAFMGEIRRKLRWAKYQRYLRW